MGYASDELMQNVMAGYIANIQGQLAKEKDYENQVRKYRRLREEDMAAGKKRGEEIFGNQALGRLEEGRSAEIADIIERRKQNLAGFTPEEQNAMRENNVRAIQQQGQGQSRSLAASQARNGVRGATAVAQQATLNKAQQQAMTDAERDLFLKQVEAKRGALDNYSKEVTGARGEETARQQFNLGQANKEKYGQLATEMGFAELGSADRTALNNMLVGEKQAEAAKNQKGGK